MINSLKYGLIGFSGRLGNEVINTMTEKGYELVFKSDIHVSKQKDVPQILINCSLPESFEKTVGLIKKFNVPLIIATTGLSGKQLSTLHDIAEKTPVVQSYNFSIGIQILIYLTRLAKEKLEDWDVEITETHHRFKKDKPSGTAKMIQNLFPEREINTSSLRLGNVVGEHKVSFGGLGEVLSISHTAISRRTFAEGILKSAEFVLSKGSGFYTFSDVIFGKKDS